MPGAPASWYPDPVHRHELRYWNGDAWTQHVSDHGVVGQDPLSNAATAKGGQGDAAADEPAVGSVSEVLRLTYIVGNEHNPGNPFGRCVVALGGQDVVADLHTRDGQMRRWTARLHADDAARLAAALRASGFPKVPPHLATAGSSMRELHVTSGMTTGSATLGLYEALTMPGYAEAFAILDTIITLVTQGAARFAPPGTDPVVVSDIAPVAVDP